MQIEEKFLTINKYSRPGLKLEAIKTIVMHWTANPVANACDNRNFFEQRKYGHDGYGSAHYIIDQDGTIIQCMPLDEVAYHCGSSKPDPVSNKIYTDLARQKFGVYYTVYSKTPNFVTLSIELCPTDDKGNFTEETIISAIELCQMLVDRFALTADDIITHHDVVGWKDCPRLWINNPLLFQQFKQRVFEVEEKEIQVNTEKQSTPKEQQQTDIQQKSLLYKLLQMIRSFLCGKQ